MSKRRKHYPPSRERYEQTHPVISVRVSQDLHQRLRVLQEESGKSVGDVLREALGLQRASTKSAYSMGYNKGLAEATAKYRIEYRCNVCGGTLQISSEAGKKAAATYMREHGWRHADCHNRQG